jgi:phage terminase Nu1 subunit (DNA packaging protein)
MTKSTKVGLQVDRHDMLGILGVSERTFGRLERSRVVSPETRGRGGRASRYAVASTVQAYLAHATRPPSGTDESSARARRDLSQARLGELKLAREQGELVPRDEVVAEAKSAVMAIRTRFVQLPRQMGQAGIITREQEIAVTALVNEALRELSEWRWAKDEKAADERGVMRG